LQADIQALEARVKALEQESRALRSALLSQQRPDAAAVTLRSPVSGHILRLEHPSDGVVPAGAPLLVLGDPQRMEVMAEVLSQDAVRLRPGSPVELRGWGGADVLRGRLRTVEPFAYTKVSALGVEEKRVQVIADLDQRPPELGDGFRVEASFLLWESPRVLKIPASALFRRRGTWAVYVVQQGRARERQVRIGERNAQEAQILTGLKAGDEVLLYPGAQLSDGVRVQAAPRR
jgi:HlyD family secretion protein